MSCFIHKMGYESVSIVLRLSKCRVKCIQIHIILETLFWIIWTNVVFQQATEPECFPQSGSCEICKVSTNFKTAVRSL